jgi:SAM-dependent methyltransferase
MNEAIKHELEFWKGFVQTERFLEGWVSNKPTPELRIIVRQFIEQCITEETQVLDVGSGVVSILNGTVPQSQLTSSDPLSGYYQQIFDYKKYGLIPPRPYSAEELPYINQFDIVHISNALDHSQDPMEAFIKLHRSCKDEGFIIIQGFENEADFENWQGFHQWNISLDGKEFNH